MSYCRWSSDKFKSAVYVYESQEGYMTHVAGSHRLEEFPGTDPYSFKGISETNTAAWQANYNAFHKWLEATPTVPIGLPHDGETFIDATPQQCAATLTKLKNLGYHIPDGVIEELEGETHDDE